MLLRDIGRVVASKNRDAPRAAGGKLYAYALVGRGGFIPAAFPFGALVFLFFFFSWKILVRSACRLDGDCRRGYAVIAVRRPLLDVVHLNDCDSFDCTMRLCVMHWREDCSLLFHR